MKLFLVLVGMLNQHCESFLMRSVVLRKPAASAVDMVLVGNAGVLHGGKIVVERTNLK